MVTAEPIRIIDVDTHISEPPDLWTARVSKKWGDQVLHVRPDNRTGALAWFIADDYIAPAPAAAMAGWKEPPPSNPPNYDEAHPGAFKAEERLQLMDEEGIYAHIIYPNVGGFGSGRFLQLKDPELMLDSVRAYNDFMIEWCAPGKGRLVPLCVLPFWDVEESVKELHRARKLGHKGVIFTSEPDSWGQPMLADPYWNPVFAAAQDLQMPVNFHIGSGDVASTLRGFKGNGRQANFAKGSVALFLNNANAVMEIIFGGICARFPNLKFVSVESGIGWVPFLLEAMDWQFIGGAVRDERPDLDLLPSEYFRRQIYACFWFESTAPRRLLDVIGHKNVLFETDFPHPTSLYPAKTVREHVASCLAEQPEEVRRAVLHDNAAELYHLDF
jgi:uncharacterized protein